MNEELELIKEDLADLQRMLMKAKETGKKQMGLTAEQLQDRIKEIEELLS